MLMVNMLQRPQALVRALIGRFNPEALAEDVRYGHAAGLGPAHLRQRARNDEPVVRVDERELHEEQLREIRGAGVDVAEVGRVIFECPPAGVGHSRKGDRDWNGGERLVGWKAGRLRARRRCPAS